MTRNQRRAALVCSALALIYAVTGGLQNAVALLFGSFVAFALHLAVTHKPQQKNQK